MIKIKVCGMTQVEQIGQLVDMGVDYAGLIFYDKSPRYVKGKIEEGEIKSIADKIKLVGVFVNEEEGAVKEIIEKYNLNAVQLCGSESPEYCRNLMKIADVIKVISVGEEVNLALLKSYENSCHSFLFDTHSKKYGGSGKQFDWKILHNLKISHPFFLSGGISEQDTNEICKFSHPSFFGIDINSRFEREPGIKDIQKIKSFLKEIRKDENKSR